MDPIAPLVQRIMEQGTDDKARAKALGVSTRTITEYKGGKVPRIVRALLACGILVVRGDAPHIAPGEGVSANA